MDSVLLSAQRLKSFQLICETIEQKFFDKNFGGVNWKERVAEYEILVRNTEGRDAFYNLMQEMVGELECSHLRVVDEDISSEGSSQKQAWLPSGFEVEIIEGKVYASRVEEDTDSWVKGLRNGFRLIAINGQEGVKTDLLKGEKGSQVELSFVDKEGEHRIIIFHRNKFHKTVMENLVSSKIELSCPNENTELINIKYWSFDLPAQLEAIRSQLSQSDMLVIDLRGNPGGVNPGMDWLFDFIYREPGVVLKEFKRDCVPAFWRYDGSGNDAYKGKIAVLIDNFSGSSSEIFAAKIKETGRGTVFGQRSAGAVLNSTTVPLPAGGYLQYPHTLIETEGGTRIEGEGVEPDVECYRKVEDLCNGGDSVLQRVWNYYGVDS